MTISPEDVRWKLAVCKACEERRMMLAGSASCPECERGGQDATLSPEDIRWIISYRGPKEFVRGAWALASESTNAAMGLDPRTGATTAHRWPDGKDSPVELGDILVLAVCPAARKAELPKLLVAGAEGFISAEDAEELAAETVVRSALGDEGRRFWDSVNAQLQQMSGLRERS